MKVIIMGCGRVGATLAMALDREGHDVTVLDTSSASFARRLPPEFRGRAIVGNGIDVDVLRRAGIASADAFVIPAAAISTNGAPEYVTAAVSPATPRLSCSKSSSGNSGWRTINFVTASAQRRCASAERGGSSSAIWPLEAYAGS